MEKSKIIRFAVIGLGHIGKRHVEMIRRNENCKLVAVCDIQPSESLGFLLNDETFYYSIDELLENEKNNIDVVNICVPNGLHSSFALKVLNFKKNVVIEKPMALTKIDAERIIFKSLEVSKHVFVVMQNRYSPTSVWLKELVKSKNLGKFIKFNLTAIGTVITDIILKVTGMEQKIWTEGHCILNFLILLT